MLSPKHLAAVLFAWATWGASRPPAISFTDASSDSHIDFVLRNSGSERRYLPETMAGGIAAFDFDGDGRLDLFFCNGAVLPGLDKSAPEYANRLYRNAGNGSFIDVTASSGLSGSGFSIAAAAADFDNDGRPDLVVTGLAGARLYRNLGNGHFEDVTASSGIHDTQFGVAAAWLDYDRDGLLDLLIVHYVQWSAESNPLCHDPSGKATVYCHPREFAPTASALYRNLGNGKFRDVSAASGIAQHIGKGMGAAIADYDRDGYPDIFVTNDVLPNFLFHNQRDGTFREVAIEAGVALPDNGTAVSGMGADFRDFDNDGLPDVLFTALQGQTFPLFRNIGQGQFTEASQKEKLAALTARISGWSIALADLDNDGWKDIFASTSHVADNVETFSGDRYKLPNAVFRNLRGAGFADASSPDQTPRAHRGAVVADINNDGRLDAVVSVLGERPEVWLNSTRSSGNWIDLKLIGTKSNRDGIGAEVRIGRQVNSMTSNGGYGSSALAPVHFGLGAATVIPDIEVRWPSGVIQRLSNIKTGRLLTVIEPARP